MDDTSPQMRERERERELGPFYCLAGRRDRGERARANYRRP